MYERAAEAFLNLSGDAFNASGPLLDPFGSAATEPPQALGGSHLSNATCLTQVLFKFGETNEANLMVGGAVQDTKKKHKTNEVDLDK